MRSTFPETSGSTILRKKTAYSGNFLLFNSVGQSMSQLMSQHAGISIGSKILIVDGHSMIFAWSDLAERHRRRTASARDELVRRLNTLQDASDWHVVVVFDGKGAQATEASEPGGIQVFYSKSGQTADTVIERLTAKYAGEFHVTVATDDLMERTTVASLGGQSMGSQELSRELEAGLRMIDEKIRSLRHPRRQRRPPP